MERKGFGPEKQGMQEQIASATREITNYVKGAPAGSGKRMAFVDQLELLKTERDYAKSGQQDQRIAGKLTLLDSKIIDRKGSVEGYPEAYDDLEEKIDNFRETIRPLYPLVSTGGAEDHLVTELKEIGRDSFRDLRSSPHIVSKLVEKENEQKERIKKSLTRIGKKMRQKEKDKPAKIIREKSSYDIQDSPIIIKENIKKLEEEKNYYEAGISAAKIGDINIVERNIKALEGKQPEEIYNEPEDDVEYSPYPSIASIAVAIIPQNPDFAEKIMWKIKRKKTIINLGINRYGDDHDYEYEYPSAKIAKALISYKPDSVEKIMDEYAKVGSSSKNACEIAIALAPYNPDAAAKAIEAASVVDSLSQKEDAAIALAQYKPESVARVMKQFLGRNAMGDIIGINEAARIAVALAPYNPDVVEQTMNEFNDQRKRIKKYLEEDPWDESSPSNYVDLDQIAEIAIALAPYKKETSRKIMENCDKEEDFEEAAKVAIALGDGEKTVYFIEKLMNFDDLDMRDFGIRLATINPAKSEEIMNVLEEKGEYKEASEVAVAILRSIGGGDEAIEDPIPKKNQMQKDEEIVDLVLGASPLEVEWNHLSQLSQRLARDLNVLKLHSDTVGYGMEPYERLCETLQSAGDLMQSNPGSNLAKAAARELQYVRQGLDKHREWMEREAGRRGRQFRDDQRAAEKEQDSRETRAYRDTMGRKGRPPESSAAREAARFTNWANRNTYRPRRPGGWD